MPTCNQQEQSKLRAYYLEFWKIAVKDFKTFWTAQRIVTSVPAPLIGFITSAVVSKGLHSFMAFIQAVEISLLSGVAGFALTMLASLVRAPKLLNDQRLSDIKTRDEENRRLRNEIETDRARLARAAQINPDFRLGVDASAKDKVFMNLSGLPHPVALPVIFLTVVNRSQTHFEVVRYCLHKLGKL